MSQKTWQISRRTMLRGMGAALALPFLEAMAPVGRAFGASLPTAAKPPVRMACIYFPNGVWTKSWIPETAGADYVLFGTVFSGGSKGDVPEGDRLASLTEAARARRVPVIAIGGIDPARAARCFSAGAAGVAAITIFLPEGRAPLAMGVRGAIAALRHALI